jgi:hypothetical protein
VQGDVDFSDYRPPRRAFNWEAESSRPGQDGKERKSPYRGALLKYAVDERCQSRMIAAAPMTQTTSP